MQELMAARCDSGIGVTADSIATVLEDEQGYPHSINRGQADRDYAVETLCSIVMDLKAKTAMVKFGRSTESTEQVRLAF